MATVFPCALCKVLLIAATIIALIIFAGEVCPSVAYYDICVEGAPTPGCRTWCVNQGYPKGGDFNLGICCCILLSHPQRFHSITSRNVRVK
ncbi:hypothetical protein PVAP13_8NG305184 [Panicum virgatum]|uniref:LCR n=1 Tax=Panicum virgatum TaxID=38727 RepID=A0A8T0PB19_PANVG|nr:hypothetical protein PVAP13_8NG305184 [Panicum virgatum]